MLQRLKDVVGLEIGISREDFSLGPSTIRTIPRSSPGLSLSAGDEHEKRWRADFDGLAANGLKRKPAS